MSDWIFLNRHRIKVPTHGIPMQYITKDGDGFCGLFRFGIDAKIIRCIASDGEAAEEYGLSKWEHVSVSIEHETKPPTWKVMCMVKDLFWDDDQVVVQFHPRKKDYVNHHPGCLHLWRCLDREFPTPEPIMVGPRSGMVPT